MENFETFRLDQTGQQTQAILDQVSTNTADIAQLRALYEALTQSEPVIIQPSDTWPVADPQENVIYRVTDRVNTPPQSYSDYMWNGTAMVLMATYNNPIDNEPTPGSNNLVKSGGVAASIVFDISAYHATGSTLATYSNLAAALGTDGANVPASVRKGGMSVKFVQSSDNKYVQYMYIGTSTAVADFTNVANWEKMNLEEEFSQLGQKVENNNAALNSVNLFNKNEFIADQTNVGFYEMSHNELRTLRVDSRAESSIKYRIFLKANIEYIFTLDYVNTTSALLNVFDSNNNYRFPIYPSCVFSVDQDGYYGFKLFSFSKPAFIFTNPGLYEYDKWLTQKRTAIVPDFSINNDAEAINRAIFTADFYNIEKIHVPYKSEGYNIQSSIRISSHHILEVAPGTLLKLADAANIPLLVNSLRSGSSNIKNNTNIVIRGGVWDGNSSNQTSKIDADNTPISLFHFASISNVTFENLTLKDSRTYAALIGNCENVNIHDVIVLNAHDVQDNQDGIHFLGPAKNITINECYIESTDNAIALNSNDVSHGTYGSNGDIKNIFIKDIVINNSNNGQGILLLSANTLVDNVTIDGVKGSGRYLVASNHFNLAPGYIGTYTNISIKNVDMDWEKAAGSYCFIDLKGNYNNLNIENINVKNNSGWSNVANMSAIRLCKADGGATTFKNTIIKNICFSNEYLSAVGNTIIELKWASFENTKIDGVFDYTKSFLEEPIVFRGIGADNIVVQNMFIKSLSIAGWIKTYATSAINSLMLANLNTDGYSSMLTRTGNNTFKRICFSNCGKDFRFSFTPNGEYYMGDSDIVHITNSQFPSISDASYYPYGQIIIKGATRYRCVQAGSLYKDIEWAPNTNVADGDIRYFGTSVYECCNGGVTGESFNPTTEEFVDGTARWRYLYENTASFETI